MTTKTGILLVNLGTPGHANHGGVKAFSASFCTISGSSTCRATSGAPVSLHHPADPLPQVAKLYQQVWTEQGLPHMVISQQQRAA